MSDTTQTALIHQLGRAIEVSASVLRAYWSQIGKKQSDPDYWQDYQDNVIIRALQAYDKYKEQNVSNTSRIP